MCRRVTTRLSWLDPMVIFITRQKMIRYDTSAVHSTPRRRHDDTRTGKVLICRTIWLRPAAEVSTPDNPGMAATLWRRNCNNRETTCGVSARTLTQANEI